MEMPYFKFFPGDWKKDPGVQSLTLEQKGFWFELLLLMHESPRRGYLLDPAGNNLDPKSVGLLLNLDPRSVRRLVEDLLKIGVMSRSTLDGSCYSRRMVRDEIKRQIYIENGKKGGSATKSRHQVAQAIAIANQEEFAPAIPDNDNANSNERVGMGESSNKPEEELPF
jgi:hypothetical protein